MPCIADGSYHQRFFKNVNFEGMIMRYGSKEYLEQVSALNTIFHVNMDF